MTVTRYKSNYHQAMPFSLHNAAISLNAATADDFTIPGTNNEKYIAIFSYPSDSSVFVALNFTAAVPSGGNITFPSTSQFKPERRVVQAGDKISLIATNATECGVHLYRIE